MTTIAHGQYPQKRPNGLWRGMSAMTMGFTSTTSKFFLYGFNNVEVIGLDKFVELLASRQDPFERQRGLITGKHFWPRTKKKKDNLTLTYTFPHS